MFRSARVTTPAYPFLSGLLCLFVVFAIEAGSADEPEEAPTDVLELDPVSVVGPDFSIRQEAVLRTIRKAIDTPKSGLEKDRDTLVCWLEAEIGSRIKYLNCARNGDIWANRPTSTAYADLFSGRTIQSFGKAGYGTIMRSSKPVNKPELRQIMSGLSDSEYFDQEFTAMVDAGESPPRDVPGETELKQFAKIWIEVEKLNKRSKSEKLQIEVMQTGGFTLKRYNRIAELIDTFPSIQAQTAKHIADFK